MRFKILRCITVILVAGWLTDSRAATTDTNGQPGEFYRDEIHGFQLTVPNGWMAHEVGHEANHYGYEFLTINNQRRDLDFGDGWWGKFGWNFHGKETQLQSNEVYVSIGYVDGPFQTVMRTDTAGDDLRRLLATNRQQFRSAEGTAYYGLEFFKWGQCWLIEAEMEEPVTEESRQNFMALLQSFRFLDTPLKNACWAEALAWKELPQRFRADGNWPTVLGYGDELELSARLDSRIVIVKKIGAEYLIKFRQGSALARTWEYVVSRDGKVVLMSYQHLLKWKVIGVWFSFGSLVASLVACLTLVGKAGRKEN